MELPDLQDRARVGLDPAELARLQDRMAEMWPQLTMRRVSGDRTLIVLHSISFSIPDMFAALRPAYEERFLIYVLTLATAPDTRVIYVTSQPILPRLFDYYLDLFPGLDRDELRSRLFPVSVGDSSPTPLTQKILERPRLVRRIRDLIPDTSRATLVPFVTTWLEARLAVELGVPVYGPHPELGRLGTKTGSREVFAAAGIPHPRGHEGLRTVDDAVDALTELARLGVPAALMKYDAGVSGTGNALVDLEGAQEPDEVRDRVQKLTPEDPNLSVNAYLQGFEVEGGVVEELITGEEVASPSVQLRGSPVGLVEVLTTHDQVLGGPRGQTYLGCRFPADPGYARLITKYATSIGHELSHRGVVGRFAVDFIAVRQRGEWSAYALEINLRNGGTTHPYVALTALTDGVYNPEISRFEVEDCDKHYLASDHLDADGLNALTPDDVIDLMDGSGLGWDPVARRGVVLHMISGVAVAGVVGLTAIGDTAADAASLYDAARDVLVDAATAP